jgi:hypothetical protein
MLKYRCFIYFLHNSQPWDSTELWTGDLSDNGCTVSNAKQVKLKYKVCCLVEPRYLQGCPDRDHMVVGFTTTNAISVYHH